MIVWAVGHSDDLALGSAGLMVGVGVGGFGGMKYLSLIPRSGRTPNPFGLPYSQLAWVVLLISVALASLTFLAAILGSGR